MNLELSKHVLAHPDNDLEAIARRFRGSGEPCRHIDRHMIAGVLDRSPEGELVAAACAAALALARKWVDQSALLRGPDLLISDAVAMIDDEWIRGEENPPPPHVYLCLARDRASFRPVRHAEAVPSASSGIPMVDSLLNGHARLFRLDGAFEGDPGAWMLTCKPG